MAGSETNSFGIILREGEQIVHNWKGVYFEPHQRIQRGYLVLTDQRLVWCQETGFFTKTVFVAFDVYLREIKGISMGGHLIYVTGESGAKRFGLNGVGSEEFSTFKEMIMRQKEKESQAPVTKGIITKELVMIPCENCKALISQTSTFCPNCGAKRK